MVERWVVQYGRERALKICEADQTERSCLGRVRADRIDHHARAVVERESADARAKRGKGDRRQVTRLRKTERAARRAANQRR